MGYNDGRLARPAVPAGAPALLDEVAERPGQADVDDESYVWDVDPGAKRRRGHDRTPLGGPLPYDLRLLLAAAGLAVVDRAGEQAGDPFGAGDLLAIYDNLGLAAGRGFAVVAVAAHTSTTSTTATTAAQGLAYQSYGRLVLLGCRARDGNDRVADVRPVCQPSHDKRPPRVEVEGSKELGLVAGRQGGREEDELGAEGLERGADSPELRAEAVRRVKDGMALVEDDTIELVPGGQPVGEVAELLRRQNLGRY